MNRGLWEPACERYMNAGSLSRLEAEGHGLRTTPVSAWFPIIALAHTQSADLSVAPLTSPHSWSWHCHGGETLWPWDVGVTWTMVESEHNEAAILGAYKHR